MQVPEHFEILKDYSCYRMVGHGSLAEAANKVIEIIEFSRQEGIGKLLIDTTKWTGHGSPSTLERYEVASAFAKAAASEVKMAMVVRPELMDPEKFEVTVATNRGMAGNVFASGREALTWLLDPESR